MQPCPEVITQSPDFRRADSAAVIIRCSLPVSRSGTPRIEADGLLMRLALLLAAQAIRDPVPGRGRVVERLFAVLRPPMPHQLASSTDQYSAVPRMRR